MTPEQLAEHLEKLEGQLTSLQDQLEKAVRDSPPETKQLVGASTSVWSGEEGQEGQEEEPPTETGCGQAGLASISERVTPLFPFSCSSSSAPRCATMAITSRRWPIALESYLEEFLHLSPPRISI